MLELNEIGQDYVEHLETQMKDLNLYLEGDTELMLNDCGLQYQLYKDELELSLDEMEETVHHMKAQRHLKFVMDFQKQLGLGPTQRAKLKAFKDIQEEKSIQDLIKQELMNE